jgi:hypothetical protein
MRRVLMVLLVLISSVLLIQAPAHARHYFYRVHLDSIGNSGTFTVTTDCPANSRFVLRSPSFNVGPDAGKGFHAQRVPASAPIGKTKENYNIRKFQFTTKKLSSKAKGTATFTATCNDHELSVGTGNSGTEMQKLPLTGVPTLPLLVLGIGLVLAGGTLIALGRITGSSPGRR